jgi:hypothetical protein
LILVLAGWAYCLMRDGADAVEETVEAAKAAPDARSSRHIAPNGRPIL